MIIKGKRKELEKKAASLIASSLTKTIRKKGFAVLAIPGGRSVVGIFRLLAKKWIPWQNVHIFMTDERLVPINNKNNNYKLAYDSFIKKLIKERKLLKENIHPLIFTRKIKKDIENYENELKSVSSYFDIVLLSAGEEGHVASLFPNHETIKSKKEFFVSTNNSPKLPKNRMSASKKLLSKSKISVLLFFGEGKRQAFENFNNPRLSIYDCPAKIVNQIREHYILTDLT
ncbi:6-phosphogluconolactonase [Candidatus Pacearchaeota archaeon]|nr:6-phosphogluconolactonase [Candidatus Pacearchaeota archaeon]